MNGLYPIVRRVRRPLVIQDDDAGPRPAPPVAVPLVEDEQPVSYATRVPARKGKHGTHDRTEGRS